MALMGVTMLYTPLASTDYLFNLLVRNHSAKRCVSCAKVFSDTDEIRPYVVPITTKNTPASPKPAIDLI